MGRASPSYTEYFIANVPLTELRAGGLRAPCGARLGGEIPLCTQLFPLQSATDAQMSVTY